MERAGRLIGLVGGAVLVVGLGVLGWRWRSHDTPASTAFDVPGTEGPHVTAEVLNTTTVDGLARDMTERLRRRGIDVVYFGSAASADTDSTRIIVRRGDSTSGVLVRNALGFGRVTAQPDPRLLLDVTVLVGADAAPGHRHP